MRPWTVVREVIRYDRPGFLRLADLFVVPEDATASESAEDRSVLQIDCPDWVNVVAVLGEGAEAEVVLIRQWRFGTAMSTLEIPGGMVDPGETPEEAARRELLEETGYEARSWQRIGQVTPNPALFTNRCTTLLAMGLDQVESEPAGDGHEEIEVELVKATEVPDLVRAGEIDHALVIAALHHWELFRRQSQEGVAP